VRIDPEYVPLFDMRTKGCTLGALKTASDGLALQPGEWKELDNLRRNNRIPTARGGMSAALSSILADGEFRGVFSGAINGTEYVVVAVYDGSKTRIYSTTDLSTWTELTATSGRFGNTRLTGNAPVSFALIKVPSAAGTAADVLIACDGTGYVLNLGALSATYTAPMKTVLQQDTIRDIPVHVDIIEYGIGIEGTNVYTASGANLTAANNGTSPNLQMRITIGSGTANGDTIKCSGQSAASVNNGSTSLDRQFVLGIDTSYTLLWDKFKLESNSGEVLWDPTNRSSYAEPIPISVDASNRTLWVFNWPNPKSNVSRQYVILTWVAATAEAPSTTQYVDIFLMGYTYGTNARADLGLAVTNECSNSGVESPGVVYSTYVTQTVASQGGPVLNGAVLPRSGLLMANYTAPIKNVTAAELANGVDYVNFYYAEPGIGEYRWVGRLSTASWSGSAWAYGSGTAGALLYVSALSNSVGYATLEKFLPSGYHVAPPACGAVAYVRGRAFFGAAASAGGDVYISEYGNPYRLLKFPRFVGDQLDESSPTSINVGEPCTFIKALSSSTVGSSTIFFGTKKQVLASRGLSVSTLSNLGVVSSHGSVSPYSAVVLNDTFYYLDTEMQVRAFSNGGSRILTRNTVDDLLKAIPAARRRYAVACGFDYMYYLFFTETGGTENTRGLVWRDDGDGWVTDTPPVAIDGICSFYSDTDMAHRLITFGTSSSALKAFEYDDPTQDQDLGTTDIVVTFAPGDLTTVSEENIVIGHVAVACDGNAGGLGGVTRTYKPTGVSSTSQIDLDPGTANQVMRWDTEPTPSTDQEDAAGTSASLTITLPLKAGAKIYRIAYKLRGGGLEYTG